MASCEKWLEDYIKQHQPVSPGEVYAAGKTAGFSRRDIKNARRWFGKYIDTQMQEGVALWRWGT